MCGCSKRGNNNVQRSRTNIQAAPRANVPTNAAPKIAPMVSPLSLTGVPRLSGARANDIRRIQKLQQEAIRKNKGIS